MSDGGELGRIPTSRTHESTSHTRTSTHTHSLSPSVCVCVCVLGINTTTLRGHTSIHLLCEVPLPRAEVRLSTPLLDLLDLLVGGIARCAHNNHRVSDFISFLVTICRHVCVVIVRGWFGVGWSGVNGCTTVTRRLPRQSAAWSGAAVSIRAARRGRRRVLALGRIRTVVALHSLQRTPSIDDAAQGRM
eukprot:scpid78371/ scgid16985/ 